MNRVKRILCLCTAFLLIASAVSCNDKKKSITPDNSGSSVSSDKKENKNISENLITEYFDAQKLDFSNQINTDSISNMQYINDKIYFIASKRDYNYEYSLKSINMDDMSSQDISAQTKLYSAPASYISDGKIYAVEFDPATQTNKICVGDAQTGTVEHEIKNDTLGYPSAIRADKNGNIYIFSSIYITIYKNDLTDSEVIDISELMKDTDVSNKYAYCFEVSPEGEIYLGFFEKVEEEVKICKLKPDHTIDYISDNFSDMHNSIDGIYLSDNGNLFVCSGFYSTEINEISADTGDTICRYEIDNIQYIYGICNGRLIYCNDSGIYAYDFDNDNSDVITSFDDPSIQLTNVIIDGNTLNTVSQINSDTNESFYISDADGKIEKEIPIKGTYGYGCGILYNVTSDGKISYLKIDHDVASEDGYVYETTGYSVYKINDNDQCEKLFDLPTTNTDESCTGFFTNSAGDFCICRPDENLNSTVYCYDTSGNLLSSTPISEKNDLQVSYSIPYGNKILFFYYDEYKLCASPFNTDSMQFETIIEFDDIVSNVYSIVEGNNGYDFYYNDGICIYGYKIETGKREQIIEWVNTDVTVTPYYFLLIDPETIICSGNSDEFSDQEQQNKTSGMYKFIKADKERLQQINSKKVIILAGTDITESDIGSRIKKFNRTNDDYRILAKDYAKYRSYSDYSYSSGSQQLDADLISGNIPDIIMLDQSSDPNPYLVKGMFADLGKLIDDDKDLNRDDYISSIFDAYTYKDCLYQIIPSFHCVSIIAKTSLVGDKPGWTYDEFFGFINDHPDIPAFNDFYKQSGWDSMLISAYINDYVDLANSTCDFDNETFIKLITFINGFGSYEDDTDMNNEKSLKNNDMLMSFADFYSLGEYHEFQEEYAGESITFKGFPSKSGISNIVSADTGFSISEKSDKKDGAWQFIRQFLTEDYQDINLFSQSGWPINKSSLQKMFEEKHSDQDTSYSENSTMRINDQEIEIPPMTEESKKKFIDYIKAPAVSDKRDSKIMQIVDEETSLYYDGGTTAEEAASAIQSKVKLYLCELN